MKEIVIFLIAAVAFFATAFSAINLGWPPVGFEWAGFVYAFGNLLGSVCSLVAIVLVVRRWRKNRLAQ